MTKLLEQSQKICEERTEASLIAKGMTGDISQKGDWTGFRNEVKDGENTQFTRAMFNPMPSQGIYRWVACRHRTGPRSASSSCSFSFFHLSCTHPLLSLFPLSGSTSRGQTDLLASLPP